MKTIKIILLLAVLTVQGFSQTYDPKYLLTGTLPGYKKNYIYLRKGPVTTDSVKVINGIFTFTGRVSEPMQANLFDKDGEINAFILENEKYTLTGTRQKGFGTTDQNAAGKTCTRLRGVCATY